MATKLTIGTRGSALALWQANWVADQLRELGRGEVEVEIRTIKTTGDKILDAPLAKIGDKGLFVKEIENALLAGEVDLAVHSMKDVPTALPEGLTLGAMCRREDARDALLSTGPLLKDLSEGATVGTSSLRRKAQLLFHRPDLRFVDVRGNLNTRVRKMNEGLCDAMVLAIAGLKRMGWQDQVKEVLDATVLLPAVGQGSVGIEVREADLGGVVAAAGGAAALGEPGAQRAPAAEALGRLIPELDHYDTRVAVTAERALMRRLEGGCQVPIGAHARVEFKVLNIEAMVASLDGSRLVRDSASGDPREAEQVGVALAERLLAAGADEILAEVRASAAEDDGPPPVPSE